jgi:hypothetical protein
MPDTPLTPKTSPGPGDVPLVVDFGNATDGSILDNTTPVRPTHAAPLDAYSAIVNPTTPRGMPTEPAGATVPQSALPPTRWRAK